jgi:hypothetical protein
VYCEKAHEHSQPPDKPERPAAADDTFVPLPCLSGTLPPSWGALANLQFLILFENQLAGTLPDTWSRLASLVEVDLSSNSGLTGGAVVGWVLVWSSGKRGRGGRPCCRMLAWAHGRHHTMLLWLLLCYGYAHKTWQLSMVCVWQSCRPPALRLEPPRQPPGPAHRQH